MTVHYEVFKIEPCAQCKGAGFRDYPKLPGASVECELCNGSGEIKTYISVEQLMKECGVEDCAFLWEQAS